MSRASPVQTAVRNCTRRPALGELNVPLDVRSGLRNSSFQVFSSDHAPYRYDEAAKLSAAARESFKKVPNGVPGIELRLALLFSEGVNKGRIDIHQFVALTATVSVRCRPPCGPHL